MSTHKITSKTKVPFPCWLWARHRDDGDWFWCWTKGYQSFLQAASHYSDNPHDQPPLGEPAPEESLPVTEPEKCEVCGGDEPCSHDFDKIGWPTPSAPSLQSVAEGAAREEAAFITREIIGLMHSVPRKLEWYENKAAELIPGIVSRLTRHFAPLFTERDERLGRLEEAREDALQALGEHPESETDLAQRIREIRQEGRDLFHDLTALRTRCEELERDKARLPEDVRTFIKRVTLVLQQHADPAKAHERTQMFQWAYRLYTQYDVEQRAARKEVQQAHEKGEGA